MSLYFLAHSIPVLHQNAILIPNTKPPLSNFLLHQPEVFS